MTSAYQQQLVEQLRAAEDELGRLRQRVTREAKLQARAEQAEARIAAVQALHRPRDHASWQVCTACTRPGRVPTPWPCGTIRALDVTAEARP
ncbi:hypothetical protein [Kitasatospora sp. NPDC001132]